MRQSLIEKAREQRRQALAHIRNRSLFAGLEFACDMNNVFDIPDQPDEGNVVDFRQTRIDRHPTGRAQQRLH